MLRLIASQVSACKAKAFSFSSKRVLSVTVPQQQKSNYNRTFASSSSPQSDEILIERKTNGVAIIHLNNETKLNPMTATMGEAFEHAIDTLTTQSNNDIRCVVLTGKGKAFSAGGDLNFLRERTKDSPQNNTKIMRQFYQRFLSLRNLPVPIISAINGPAIGAGFCVALATDIRISHPKAKLGLNFVKIGLHPGMAATHFLPQIVGTQVSNQLLLTGGIITGEEAHAMGITLLSEEPLTTAMEMANQIASNCPEAVQDLTRSLRLKGDAGLEQSLWREADCQAHSYATTMSDGLDAIVEKRDPKWN